MFLKSVHIWNYRLLLDVDIRLDKQLTLFVGKNNSGKTSIINFIQHVLSGNKALNFDDYPLICRKKLYNLIWKNIKGELSIEKLKESVPISKIQFDIDYSEENENDYLGALSPFIIDLDIDNNIARILVEYQFSITEEMLSEISSKVTSLKITDTDDEKYIKSQELMTISKYITAKFHSVFSISIKAINSSNPSVFQVKDYSQLKELFIYKKISAERGLDESDIRSNKPIGHVMDRIFKSDISQFEQSIQEPINQLKELVDNVSDQAQGKINNLLSEIVSTMIKFGYPTAEDMQLKATTQIILKDNIINETDLTYSSIGEEESLPSSHNGLGYKNLIKIVFLLHEFAQELRKSSISSIPLLFLEEPEAHMHPQLQIVFIKYLYDVLNGFSGNSIQIVLSTHSSYIANTVSFQKVRYLKRFPDHVTCKNLTDFYETMSTDNQKKEKLDFLHKYLTISRCDLYFCDKAILVEGAAERLLIPDMIKKCDANGVFSGISPSLSSQYYSIIEVGGAYAHKFFEFVDFLGIPTLILTDIDFVDKNGNNCLKENADRTSNATIMRWCHDKLNIALSTPIKIGNVYKLNSADYLTNGIRHIEFQKEENGCHPRSLEEAIMNVNRSFFGIDANTTEIKFDSKEEKKTDFALDLLVNPKFSNYNIPSYIIDGLKWLNAQSKMSHEVKITTKEKGKRQLTEIIISD